jgi:DMSO/TMAO reductase YedYZ molybdopterin-dependent catalytic subunit
MFALCFVTGLISHYQYHPWHWLPIPALPSWGYRLTQGTHVITGIALLPLLLVKLWAVYPRLFEWPPVRSLLHGLERLSVAVLVSSAIVEVVIGYLNVLQWYPWRWSFVFVHYTLAYVVAGSVLLHVAVKLPVIHAGLHTSLDEPVAGAAAAPAGLSRRGLLVATGAGVAVVATTTVGQVLTPLEPLAVLAPRRPTTGPLGIPINRTAAQAGTHQSAVDPTWTLTVRGRRTETLTLADVESLATAESRLPIACVEGWSVMGRWRGIRLIDLVHRVGGGASSTVEFDSLEQNGPYRRSTMFGPQVSRALLATHLNGQRLTVDHGYPLRLIAPDHAGVLNTKWLHRITVR